MSGRFVSILGDGQNFVPMQASTVDVTLVCEGKCRKAHKLVLSACSPLFRTLLSDNPCEHPIIIFQDFKFTIISKVINFMYERRLKVPEEELPDILKCVKHLSVEGLKYFMTVVDEDEGQSENAITSQSTNKLDDKPDTASASQSAHDIENMLLPQAAAMIGTPSPPKLESNNSVCRFQGFPRNEEDCVNIAATEDFEDIPLSQLEKMLPRLSSRSSSQPKKKSLKNPNESKKTRHKYNSLDRSKQQHHSNLDNSKKKHHQSSSLDLSKEKHRTTSDHSSKKHQIKCLGPSNEYHQTGSEGSRKKQHESRSLDFSQELKKTTPDHFRRKHLKSKNLDSSKEQQQQDSPNCSKKCHNSPTLLTKSTLPIVLVERMILVTDDNEQSRNHPETPEYVSTLEEQQLGEWQNGELESEGQIEELESQNQKEESEIESQKEDEMESENEEQAEESEIESQKEDETESENEEQAEESENEEELHKKVVLKKKIDMKKNKRPYVRTPRAIREQLYKIEKLSSGRRCYGCRKCSFSTMYLESLKRHIISKHEKSRHHKCDECSYAATLKHNLKRHKMEVHEAVRQFACQLCPYKAILKNGLKRHMECVHEQKKPFKCGACDFRSSQKANVKKHIIAIHEKRREFMCDFCTYRCAQKSGLNRHVKLVHKTVKN